WVPVMDTTAAWSKPYTGAIAIVERGRGNVRPPRPRVDAGRPSYFYDRNRRDEFSICPIKHVEIAVFGGLHDDFAGFSFNIEIREDQALHGVVVPFIGGHDLIVPDVFARARANGENRADEQVVATFRTANDLRIGTAVASAEVEEIEIWIVGECIPGVSAAAHFVPYVSCPGFCGHRHRFIFKRLRWIAGNGVEAPYLFTCLGIVCRHV